jgi:hypothetical protein
VEKLGKGLVLVFFAIIGYAAGLLVFAGYNVASVFLPNFLQLFTTSWFLAGIVGMAVSLTLMAAFSSLSKPSDY